MDLLGSCSAASSAADSTSLLECVAASKFRCFVLVERFRGSLTGAATGAADSCSALTLVLVDLFIKYLFHFNSDLTCNQYYKVIKIFVCLFVP